MSKYFVSYFGEVKGETSYGNTIITREEELKTEEEIRKVENAMKQKFQYDSLVLINLVRL